MTFYHGFTMVFQDQEQDVLNAFALDFRPTTSKIIDLVSSCKILSQTMVVW